jgi:hypothetical protein
MNHAHAMAACLVLAIAAAPPASARTNLGKRVTIDVTEATPQKVFELLAHELDCKITVDRAVKKPLTLRLVDKPASDIIVTICQSIECEWRFDGKNLFIKPLSASRRRQAALTSEHSKKLESRLPAGMQFNSIPLKDVLYTIGKAAGLELRPWKDEGSRQVTIDVGGKTVVEALTAIVRQIDGEGVVMMRTWAGSWGQCRLVDRRREP